MNAHLHPPNPGMVGVSRLAERPLKAWVGKGKGRRRLAEKQEWDGRRQANMGLMVNKRIVQDTEPGTQQEGHGVVGLWWHGTFPPRGSVGVAGTTGACMGMGLAHVWGQLGKAQHTMGFSMALGTPGGMCVNGVGTNWVECLLILSSLSSSSNVPGNQPVAQAW